VKPEPVRKAGVPASDVTANGWRLFTGPDGGRLDRHGTYIVSTFIASPADRAPPAAFWVPPTPDGAHHLARDRRLVELR
jgi:hypothetical protein